ncbi:beta-galactosidase GalA [Pedobacter borealis]|uniref:beta-galactosidase GalA n=1 Tax=Pedobacter borealis TaxID=475254 RepID=UPI0004931851|nr:beta-galactosidase GalA [Pedobacter borealis]
MRPQQNTKFILALLLSIFCLFNSMAQKREVFSFDKNWKFYQADVAFPVIKGHGASYANAKAGKAWGAAAPEYNDSKWTILNLPHDWAVENPFDSSANVSQGYRQRGIGWYRKSFKLNDADRGKHLELQFEGIATYATIWFNGNLVHRNWCGYTSFYVDITSMAKYGDQVNNVAIRVDANAMEGWWYEGAGIYRHTWLVKRSPVHIVTDGVFANPVKKEGNNWTIPVEVNLNNIDKNTQKVVVKSTLFDKAGNKIVSGTNNLSLSELQTGITKFDLQVANPKLWSIENPELYKIETVVEQDGKTVDKLVTKCGFRTAHFDVNTGFYLNGKNIKLHGVCNHQDHAGVGVALPDAIWEFRLKKLKEMGVNAYRCSHNPPPIKMLELCDSLGIMVMDENRNFNVSPEYMRQMEWLVRRDRNHPSIIMWSVFNEEPMQGTEQGYEMVRRMSALVKSLDTTRVITAAMNGGLFSKLNVSHAVDVVGFNYQTGLYDRFRKENPDKKLTSSEDISSFQIRGEYKTDKANHIIDEYDSEAAPWGETQRNGWKPIAERPWLAGQFIWTGFDYRGEPTPFAWPSASSFFGIMDLCGFPKMAFYLKQAQWRKDIDVLQLAPHWNWPADSIGKPIKVMAMSNADSVSIKLNGKTIGGQKVDQYEMNTFNIAYKPGTLEAFGYKKGKLVSKFKTETTGKAVALKLEPYLKTLANDGLDAIPVTVQAVDSKGRAVPTANLMVTFNISNKGKIIGLGNGNPNSHELEKGNKRSLFNGLAQVILQAVEGEEGVIELTATADGLKPAKIILPLNRTAVLPQIDAVKGPLMVNDFTMSPFVSKKPNAKQTLSDNDMNSWQPVKAGELIKFANGTFVLFNTNFMMEKANAKAVLKLNKLVGKAEVWINDQLVYTKADPKQENVNIKFEAKAAKNKLVIVIEAANNTQAGLGGTVTVDTETN